MAVIKRTREADLPDGEGLGPAVQYGSIGDIYKRAKSWGVGTSPLDVEALLMAHGVRVIREEMAIDLSGFIERRQNYWVVGINQYQNSKRQRFTLAHEFAHFIFDAETLETSKHVDSILLRSEEANPMERRANEFAAQLLMPKDLFDGYVNQGIRDVERLSDLFGVSMAAVRYRALKLGYIKRY